MKKIILILTLGFIVLYTDCCIADNKLTLEDLSTPQATILTVINSLKKTQNPNTISKYISWEEAYKETPLQTKKTFNITSPKVLQKKFSQLINDPSSFSSNFPEMNNASPEVTALLFQTLVGKIKQEVIESKYKIGRPNISGDHALVNVISEFQEVNRNELVKLVKKNGSWYLIAIKLTNKTRNL